VRCCKGIRHCHPASRAVDRVYGVVAAMRSQGTAIARSQGRYALQSS
jgi:hypothetical protein